MNRNIEGGGFVPEEAQDATNESEKIEKSSEKLEFEKLLAETESASLEPNYTFSALADNEAEVKMAEKRAEDKSLRGSHLESGDSKKMAIFMLRRLEFDLEQLGSTLDTLEGWDKKGPSRTDWKRSWEQGRDKDIANLKPKLLQLGLSVPQTFEDVKSLAKSIISFENFQKLVAQIELDQSKEK